MKRWMACILLLTLLIPAGAWAERQVYADQGGVCVFAEDGRAGLMDSDGNVLLEAAYDFIEPFGDSEWAVISRDGLKGVVRRDGEVVLHCQWEWLTVYPQWGMAVGMADGVNRARTLYDLHTGEVLMEGGGKRLFYADDQYVYLLDYGYDDPFELIGPFTLTVCDGNLNPVVVLDGAGEATPIGWGFVTCTEAAPWNPGGYAVVDLGGNVLLDGLADWEQSGEEICYTRWVENPARLLLEAAGYDRKRVKNGLRWYLGVDADTAHLMTMFMEDYKVCGVLGEGGARFETRGSQIYPRDDAGLYCANARGVDRYGQERHLPGIDAEWSAKVYDILAGRSDRWGYMDETGAWVIPPIYEKAWPFVDGAAVVCESGVYHLIDTEGRRVGEAEWTRTAEWADYSWRSLSAFPAITGEGCRMVNRRGGYLSDEVYAEHDWFYTHGALIDRMDGYPPVLTDRMDGYPPVLTGEDGRFCVFDDSGNILLRADAEDWNRRDAGEGVIWLRVGGKWGLMRINGPEAGAWLVAPGYDDVSRSRNGGYVGYLYGYPNEVLDADGRVLGLLMD